MSRYEEADLKKIKVCSIKGRTSKVTARELASPCRAGMTMKEWLDALPAILKAGEFRQTARAVVQARAKKKPVIAMFGGHVIKTGCAPVLADLAENGFITHFASNGSAAIHETELFCFGGTSEDVAAELADGSFGMAADTAAVLNGAACRAFENKEGFGEALGNMLISRRTESSPVSLIETSCRLKIPYTIHVAVGTDIVHQHPDADGAAIGDASHRDFRIFAATVGKTGNGGVVLNFGSAVVMPEVFLKALSVARNIYGNITDFTTANFDMIQHYRPLVNVVKRPVLEGGRGYSITGHHELMIPLLAAAVYEEADENPS